METPIEVNNSFWKKQKVYPNYPFIKERRFIELQFLLSNIPPDTHSLTDIGCGDGSSVILLRETTRIKNFYCYDIAENIIFSDWGKREAEVFKYTANFNDTLDNTEIKESDVCICMNMFPCIIEDSSVEKIIKKVRSPLFLLRITCEEKERVEINKFSEDLGDNIANVYRKKEEYVSMLSPYFNDINFFRCFPDEMESKYGSKQYFFICKK